MPQKTLLRFETCWGLGSGLVGIFFLFFIQRAFGLAAWQLVGWMAIIMLIFGLLVYPINAWGIPKVGIKKMIQIGVILDLIFYVTLALQPSTILGLLLLSVFFLLHLMCFWPSFNYMMTKATANNGRGSFLGHMQMIRIGVGVVTPILTGFLLDQGSQQWVIGGVILFFMLALRETFALPDYKNNPLQGWSKNTKELVNILKSKRQFWGLLPDILTDAVMWVIWPLYFKSVVASFTIMGAITSFVALLEMGTSKIIGRTCDRIGARKMLQFGVWARLADLWLRAAYSVFAPTWFVVAVQGAGSVFGPLYQIPYEHRLISLSEEIMPKGHELDYFLVREIYLGIGRAIFWGISAFVIFTWGIKAAAILFIIAGLSALGAKRF